MITPPEFSKNKIEKSILEHVFSEGGVGGGGGGGGGGKVFISHNPLSSLNL